jgi:hypothetical protein
MPIVDDRKHGEPDWLEGKVVVRAENLFVLVAGA